MTGNVDVLIAGAGPAGLAAGIVFARRGVNTLICESRQLPADKVCGEGIMPVGVAALGELGVLGKLPIRGCLPFSGIRYYTVKGEMATGHLREGPGWGIPRLELSKALFECATETSHLTICMGQRAVPINRSDGRVLVRVGREVWATRLLVGADGLKSGVRRWAGLQGSASPHQRWGTRQHLRIKPWSDHVEIHWGPGVEAYITPLGYEQVGVTFLWDRRRFSGQQGGDRLFPSLLAAFPRLEERLTNASPCRPAQSIGPLHQRVKSPVAEGVLLIGDSAGYIDALTGEGISLGLQQALSLKETVVPLLLDQQGQDKWITASQLQPYRRAYEATVRPYTHMTHLALLLARQPKLVGIIVRLFASYPGLFQYVLSANMGRAFPYRRGN
jgi:2-polyprenyl-6-methoxyphenol hydroxylase-like FAD-dependent oxidoreductase